MDEKVGPDVQNSYTSDDLVDSEKLMVSDNDLLSICVVGASGDLAKKKIFPSLFALYYKGYLPKVREGRLGVLVWLRRCGWK